jgi:23S rRNA (cytosine1962-C5)-methyltransferase
MTPVKIYLRLDLIKHLKRGNPWVFKDALEKLPSQESGLAHLYDHKKEFIGLGLFDPTINLVFRLLKLNVKNFHAEEFKNRLKKAFDLRRPYLEVEHNSYRLLNGEGDECPGLVIDVYGHVAIIKTDGEAARKFWTSMPLVEELKVRLPHLECIYLKHHHREETKGKILWGHEENLKSTLILEYKMKFLANLIDGAKTGFFLDQRENRLLIKKMSEHKSVLNLFSYTGGFSIAAGIGKAKYVTSIDLAPKAIEAAKENWILNKLDPQNHQALCADIFEWLKEQINKKEKWDLIIVDPPSMAPNEKSKIEAKKAYQELFKQCIQLVSPLGLIALSSCTGHIDYEEFIEICLESVGLARRQAKVVEMKGQPLDHPFPLSLPQMRYLKFILLQLD